MEPSAYPSSDQFADILLGHVGQEEKIVGEWFFTGLPFVFRKQEAEYTDIRAFLASDFQVQPKDICLVGSGKLGFSPAPEQFGKKFQDGTDLDIIVVSSTIFDACWIDFLRFKVRPPTEALDFEVRRITQKAERGFFWDHLNPGLLVRYSMEATRWAKTFRNLSSRRSLSKWQPQGRLYRTWDHALLYHVHGIRTVTAELTTRRAQQ